MGGVNRGATPTPEGSQKLAWGRASRPQVSKPQNTSTLEGSQT